MRILIRVDASFLIGGGHLIRCISLATELKAMGEQCEFVVCHEAVFTIPWFSNSGFPITYVPNHLLGEALAETKFIGDTFGQCDIFIVDHYERGADFEESARSWAGLVAAIEDVPDRLHMADVVIDPTFGRRAEEYRTLAPTAEVLAGADYTLVRRIFADARATAIESRARQRGTIRRVLIAFGASDPENYTGRALRQLMELPDIAIDVLIGSQHSQAATFVSLAGSYGEKLRIWQGREDIDALMLKCDLAIGGAGGQSWERCCLGLPCLMVEMAPNQRDVAAVINQNGAGVLLGKGIEEMSLHLMPAVLDLIKNPRKVRNLSNAAFKLCDGKGAQRVARALLQLHQRSLLKGN